jgi:hypothetical protein
MRGRADIDALGGDQLATLEGEGCPGFGHAAKGHFLDRQTGGAVHDGGDDRHEEPLAMDGPDCQPQPVVGAFRTVSGGCSNQRQSTIFQPRCLAICRNFGVGVVATASSAYASIARSLTWSE